MSTTYTYKLLFFYQETVKAINVSEEKGAPYEERIWLPKSQIEYDDDCKAGDQIEVRIPDWLIEQHGL